MLLEELEHAKVSFLWINVLYLCTLANFLYIKLFSSFIYLFNYYRVEVQLSMLSFWVEASLVMLITLLISLILMVSKKQQ